MQEHEKYMRRCLELAQLGAGKVSPNPMVGALIVHEGKIIAENYHQQFGGSHAEALVVNDVLKAYGDHAEQLFQESTLYVSLEPCSHHGKTPPCADLIARHRIRHVVVACPDPFDQVNGRGIAKMREAGATVIEGVLREEAEWLNRRFLTRIRQLRPYIILKWAQTADGYMAPLDGTQKWITGAVAKQLTHQWRSEEDAVLVGAKTAIADNPQLTVREWRGRNPKRVLIDKQLAVPELANIYDDSAETIVFNALKTDWAPSRKLIQLENFDLYLPQSIAYQLHLMDIQSLTVEGGAKTLNLFIEAGLWDEARVFTSPETWHQGMRAPVIPNKPRAVQPVGHDRLEVYVNFQI